MLTVLLNGELISVFPSLFSIINFWIILNENLFEVLFELSLVCFKNQIKANEEILLIYGEAICITKFIAWQYRSDL